MEARRRLQLVEVDAVAPRVPLVVAQLQFAPRARRDELANVLLAHVLRVAAHVKDLLRPQRGTLLEQRNHCACRIVDVDHRPPTAWAVDLDLIVHPRIANELVDEQVETHPGCQAVDGSEARDEARQCRDGRVCQEKVLHVNLRRRVQRDALHGALFCAWHRDVAGLLAEVRARRSKDEASDAVPRARLRHFDRVILINFARILRKLLANVLANKGSRVEDVVVPRDECVKVFITNVAVLELKAVLERKEAKELQRANMPEDGERSKA